MFCFPSFSVSMLSLKSRPFVQSSFDIYAGVPIATHVFCLFVYLEMQMSLFPSIFCTISAFSLCGEYVVRSFLPDGVFSTL